MKRFRWTILLGLGLLSASALLYSLHYAIFGDTRFIFFRGLGNLAFVPIQALVVTLIIAELIMAMNRRAKMQKMNMVIGAFFSELGTELLRFFVRSDPRAGELRSAVDLSGDLSSIGPKTLSRALGDYPFAVQMGRPELLELRDMLTSRRAFMVRLLENPSLLENENFTDLLWAVFHLTEELDARDDLSRVPDTDLEHMTGDMSRSYRSLFREWLSYMKHLQERYPFLYSFAVRTSPLETEKRVEVV